MSTPNHFATAQRALARAIAQTGRPNQPPVIKLSEGTVRYARRDVLQFLAERRRIFAGA